MFEGYDGKKFQLVDKDGKKFEVGDKVKNTVISGIFAPHKPSSSGKIRVNGTLYYPSVFELKFEEVRS